MRFKKFITVITVFVLTILSMFITFSVIAYVNTPKSISLLLPDQKYTIILRDLTNMSEELVVPVIKQVTPLISYNSLDGVLESVIVPEDYYISTSDIKTHLDAGQLEFVPSYVIKPRFTAQLNDYNIALNRIHRSPLTISLKDGSEMSSLTLDTMLLRTMLKPNSIDLNVPPMIDKESLLAYIKRNLTPKQKKFFSEEVAYQNTQKAINLRFLGEPTPVVLGVDDGPTSYGQLANKYLEVDLSQQKMYFFINNTLYKEYKVSTGAEYPTPVGEYHILNKAPLAYSEIYQVWMPYWMGFKYANDVGAYLGLHEIAHVKDVKGKPIYRYGYYIGDMMTGGCVAMEPKDSREIYNLSDVGMLVRIVK